MQPRCGRGAAEVRPRCGRGAAEVRPRCGGRRSNDSGRLNSGCLFRGDKRPQSLAPHYPLVCVCLCVFVCVLSSKVLSRCLVCRPGRPALVCVYVPCGRGVGTPPARKYIYKNHPQKVQSKRISHRCPRPAARPPRAVLYLGVTWLSPS